ncbi:hypothetical protein ACIA5D_25985 [Actinoplanes sp. NPDC051513]|uniref:hypothetical protein n=1 Tax=Actinoplanes sp. NPDC051513 TaxID=3363908 RepID=UPI0037A7A5AF
MTSTDDDTRGRVSQGFAIAALALAVLGVVALALYFVEPDLLVAFLPDGAINHLVKEAPTADDLDRRATMLTVAAIAMLALPVLGAAFFTRRALRWACVALLVLLLAPSALIVRESHIAGDHARQMRRVSDPHPPCQVHSGSNDVCPGG